MFFVTNERELQILERRIFPFTNLRGVGEDFFFPERIRMSKVSFGKGLHTRCSICGQFIGSDESGEPYKEEIGYLTFLQVTKKKSKLSEMKRVILCLKDFENLCKKSSKVS